MNKPLINYITRNEVSVFERETNKGLGTWNALDLYQNIALKSAIYPGKGTPLGLDYCALKLNGEAGELAEHVGKAMRDDNLIETIEQCSDGSHRVQYHPLTSERKAALIKEIGDCLWYLAALCRELGISLSVAALINLDKLCDRAERNKLRGSGDNR